MFFLIAQIKCFGTLKATQKIAALYKAPLRSYNSNFFNGI